MQTYSCYAHFFMSRLWPCVCVLLFLYVDAITDLL